MNVGKIDAIVMAFMCGFIATAMSIWWWLF